jgi:hypothetical protein
MPKLFKIAFKNSVRTSKKTQLFSIAIFRQIVPMQTEYETNPINKNA